MGFTARNESWKSGFPGQTKSKSSQADGTLDDTFRDGMTSQAGHVMDAELVHNLLAVFFHGFDADAEFRGDLLIRAALSD